MLGHVGATALLSAPVNSVQPKLVNMLTTKEWVGADGNPYKISMDISEGGACRIQYVAYVQRSRKGVPFWNPVKYVRTYAGAEVIGVDHLFIPNVFCRRSALLPGVTRHSEEKRLRAYMRKIKMQDTEN